MSEWPCHYILVGRTPIAVDELTWARSFADMAKRRVAFDQITEDCYVSTIFLGLDHNHWGGEPILFETIIFGGPLDQPMWRYCTYEQAEHGHAEAVVAARKACAQVKAIADAAGASEK